MVRTKKTIRKLPPKTRQIAKDLNTLENAIRRLSRRLEIIASLEIDSMALFNMKNTAEAQDQRPIFPEETDGN